jgi:hypothetical protein
MQPITLHPVQSVTITILADNFYDGLLPDQGVAKRARLGTQKLGFRCVGEPPTGVIVLVDESGFVLTLNNIGKAEEVVYPGAFHVGFRQDSREQVDALSLPESELGAMVEKCLAYDDVLRESGHFVGGEALQSSPTAKTMRVKGGKVVVTDGPYAETKEQLGGLLILEAKDINEAGCRT